jgi:hypothetical protein
MPGLYLESKQKEGSLLLAPFLPAAKWWNVPKYLNKFSKQEDMPQVLLVATKHSGFLQTQYLSVIIMMIVMW